MTRAALYEIAQVLKIEGRSTMKKEELLEALKKKAKQVKEHLLGLIPSPKTEPEKKDTAPAGKADSRAAKGMEKTEEKSGKGKTGKQGAAKSVKTKTDQTHASSEQKRIKEDQRFAVQKSRVKSVEPKAAAPDDKAKATQQKPEKIATDKTSAGRKDKTKATTSAQTKDHSTKPAVKKPSDRKGEVQKPLPVPLQAQTKQEKSAKTASEVKEARQENPAAQKPAARQKTKKTLPVPQPASVEIETSPTEKQPRISSPEEIVEAAKFQEIKPEWTGEEGPDLPETYGRTTLHVMPQKPDMAYVYWEIDPQTRERFKSAELSQSEDIQPVLRVYGSSETPDVEIPIDLKSDQSYIELLPGKSYAFEIGVKQGMKQYQIVTRSRIVHMPQGAGSSYSAPEGVTVTESLAGLPGQAEQQQERAKQIEQAQKEGRISDLPGSPSSWRSVPGSISSWQK